MTSMQTQLVKLSQIHVNNANPRSIKDSKFDKLITSLLVLPKMLELRPIVVDSTMTALGGNMRYRALCAIVDLDEQNIRERLEASKDYQAKTQAERNALVDYWLAWKDNPTAPVINAANLSDAEKREFVIKDNVSFGEWDYDALANEWDTDDLNDWGLDVWKDDNWGEDGGLETNRAEDEAKSGSLNERFVAPPFSILDTRKGYWQARKKLWRDIIGDYGESRNDLLMASLELKYKGLYQKSQKRRKELGVSFKEYLDKYVSKEDKEREESKVIAAGVSLFDPVLAEIICKWFTPSKGASIFDCFAGDTQKGVVFGECGFTFKGVELRQEQVDINNKVIAGRGLPISYVCDDGVNVANHFEPESQDLFFSCPPYFDLEKYSDLENDASNQDSYEDFIKILENAFKKAVGCLKENRFAVIVVGDVRDKSTGFYYDFCGDIKRIFKQAGMPLYNEIILIETGTSTALRAGKYMESRKVAKMHQNILVFYKGKTKEIRNNFEKIEYASEDLEQFRVDSGNESNDDKK